VVENVPVEHAAQARSVVVVPPALTCVPGAQSVHAVQAVWSSLVEYVPELQGAQIRLFVAVAATLT
jgi:hypothetical protein